MPNPIIHFEIVGGDGTQLQSFYSKVLGWNVDANNPMNYGLVDGQTNGEGGIGGGISGTQPGESNRVTVYAGVDDLQATLDAVEANGGKTIMPPTEIPGMVTIAMFTDPLGNIMGLIKNGPPPPAM